MKYICKECKQQTNQLNWSEESKQWKCVACDFKEKKTIRKEVKTWRNTLK